MNITLAVGIVGALVVLFAFILEQKHVWKNTDRIYDGANALGSLMLLWYAVSTGAVPFIITNAVWCIVSLYDVLFFKQKDKKKKVSVSAGGVVLRNTNGVWYVAMETVSDSERHAGKWYLPKGHVEYGESVLNAARREVEEEVGVPQNTLQSAVYLGHKERLSLVGSSWKIIHYYLFITQSTEQVYVPSNKKHVMLWLPLDTAVTPLEEQNEILNVARQYIHQNLVV